MRELGLCQIEAADDDELMEFVDLARLCAKVELQLIKGDRSCRAMVLNSHQINGGARSLSLVFDPMALEVLGCEVTEPKRCLDLLIKAAADHAKVYKGSYGEATFVLRSKG